MRRRGFTLVEMMMVVGVLAILMTIVISSVSDSIKASRTRRAQALCSLVQSGLATYYAQEGEWPSPLGSKVKNGIDANANNEGYNGRQDENVYLLSSAEVRQMIKALITKAKQGKPVMDISGLYVSRDPGEKNGDGFGLDFFTAVRGTEQSKKRMTTSEMYFGYPDPTTGRFRRFKMVYSIPADTLTVKRLDQ